MLEEAGALGSAWGHYQSAGADHRVLIVAFLHGARDFATWLGVRLRLFKLF
jgi:hypothetical protein